MSQHKTKRTALNKPKLIQLIHALMTTLTARSLWQ